MTIIKTIAFPNHPPRKAGYPYLAGVGISSGVLEESCVVTGRVIGVYDRQSINVLIDGVEYVGVPVYIHTDIGAREALLTGRSNPDPMGYFKDAGLMFPFPGAGESSYTYVAVVLHTDPETLQKTALGVIGIHRGFYGIKAQTEKVVLIQSDVASYVKSFSDVAAVGWPTYRVVAHIRICNKVANSDLPGWVSAWKIANPEAVRKAEVTEDEENRWYLDYAYEDAFSAVYNLTDDEYFRFIDPDSEGGTLAVVAPELTPFSLSVSSTYQKISKYLLFSGVRIGRGDCYTGFSFTPQNTSDTATLEKENYSYSGPVFLSSFFDIEAGQYAFYDRGSVVDQITANVQVIRAIEYEPGVDASAQSSKDAVGFVLRVTGYNSTFLCRALNHSGYQRSCGPDWNVYPRFTSTYIDSSITKDIFWNGEAKSENASDTNIYQCSVDFYDWGIPEACGFIGDFYTTTYQDYKPGTSTKLIDFSQCFLYDQYTGLVIVGGATTRYETGHERKGIAHGDMLPVLLAEWAGSPDVDCGYYYYNRPDCTRNHYIRLESVTPKFDICEGDTVQRHGIGLAVPITRALSVVSESVVQETASIIPADLSSYHPGTFPLEWRSAYKVRIDLYVVPYDVRISTIPT